MDDVGAGGGAIKRAPTDNGMSQGLAMGLLRKPLVWIPLIVLLAVGLYALGGFWLAPKVIRSQATSYVDQALGKTLALGEVKVNPFLLTIDLRDLAIGDDPSSPMVAAGHVAADLQLASLWQRRWNLRDVRIEAPFVQAIVREDGSLNLAELLPPGEHELQVPAAWLQSLAVSGGRIEVADHSRSLEPTTSLTPIDFVLKDFHTSPEGGGFRLSTASEAGETLRLDGRLSLRPLQAEGGIEVEALQATSVYAFLSDYLPMALTGGQARLAGHWRFGATRGEGIRLEADIPELAVDALGIRARDVESDWVSVPAATLHDTRLAFPERAITVARVQARGLQGTFWREPDGHLNVVRLFEHPPTPSSSKRAAMIADPGRHHWSIDVGRIEVSEGTIDFEDRMVTPHATFRLASTSLAATPVSLDLSQPISIDVTATLNGTAPLSARGDVVLHAFRTDLEVDVGAIPLDDVRGYIPQVHTVGIGSGSASACGTVALRPGESGEPRLRFSGDATVQGLELVEAANRRPFLSWRQLEVEGVDFTYAPDALSVRSARVQAPFARVAIAPDRSINLVRLLGGENAGQQLRAGMASMMPVRIDALRLDGGTLDFSDRSIDPEFHAEVGALRGTVTGLETRRGRRARIDLQGQVVNRYSPVRIRGETSIGAWDRHTDVAMAFSNIELPIFNPYSGRWAGYSIAKGKLSTELHYRIEDRQLQADHHVVVDQLEWGEATGSKDKVSLPVRLGTSLLKDADGVIEIDLPVGGSIDDPEFRLGPLVWDAIVNVITKVATAPFRFLGSLFDGAEEARHIDFAPGSAALPAGSGEALAALAQGLGERPGLHLDIPTGPGDALDAQAMQLAAFHAAMAAAGQAPGEAAERYAAMDSKERLDVLETLYRERNGEKPSPPEVDRAALDGLSWSERREARRVADVAWLEGQLLPRYAVDDAALAALGRDRAMAIQDALLAPGTLEPSRLFFAVDQRGVPQDGQVRLELQLR